jgi:hypothetical protein
MDDFRVLDRNEKDRSVHDGRRKCPNCGSPAVQPAPSIENLPEYFGATPTSPSEENPSEEWRCASGS